MSFSFLSLLTTAENALKAIIPMAQPIIHAAEAVAPVVEALVPSSIPVISAVEAGAASITAIAPTAVQDATAAIAMGQKIVADGSPLLTQLEALFSGLFHVTATPQAIVLTPKTTSATVPTPAPGNALS